jgi:hypothetical protein
MGSDVTREAKPKSSTVKDSQIPSDSQLNTVWDTAPTFFGKEMVLLYGAREEQSAFEGPLVKNGYIPVVKLFALDHTPQPYEKTQRQYTDPNAGTGKLELQWDERGQPSRLSFKDKAGNVEEVTLDSIDPTKVSTDVYRKTDGTVARFDFDLHGEVERGSLLKGKNRDRFDFDLGFHVRADSEGSHFALSDDRISRFIETTLPPSKGRNNGNAVAALKYFYENNGDRDGELKSVVLTFANGASYKAYPDADGKWIRQKLEANPAAAKRP